MLAEGESYCISAITLADLDFGAEKRRSQRIRRAIRGFTRDVAVVDTLVAAQALCLGLTVVTNNTRHFGRVPGLAIEKWA